MGARENRKLQQDPDDINLIDLKKLRKDPLPGESHLIVSVPPRVLSMNT